MTYKGQNLRQATTYISYMPTTHTHTHTHMTSNMLNCDCEWTEGRGDNTKKCT